MKKRGEELVKDFIFFALKLFLLIIVVIVILSIFNLFVTRNIDTLKEETFIISQRLIRSENCLAYEENERVYQGIVDIDKFDIDVINSCLVLKDYMGMNVSLEEINGQNYGSFVTNDKSKAKLSFCGSKNTPGFDCWVRKDYVLINDNGDLKPGYLSLLVVKDE